MMIKVISLLLYLFLAPFAGALLDGVDRKITARMQGRKGPKLLQPFYDLIKLFSILFDGILAWGGFRLVRHFTPGDKNRPLLCFCLLLLLPTVVANGAFWGQCDALYGALVLHALSSTLEGRPYTSLILLGVAFSCKLQTVFVLPLWGALVLLRRIPLRALLCFPAAYAATCVPALLLGKPLGDILGVYLGQASEYSDYLNLNAPNLYAFLPYDAQVDTAAAARLGILIAFALALAVIAALWLLRRRADDRVLLTAAVLLAVGVPFFLPHMHERYFFLADVLSLAWACAAPRFSPAALLVQLSSFGAYVVVLREAYTRIIALGGKLYLLDEPFTGVDGDRIRALMAALKELGAPVVLSSHEGLVRSLADQVINLDGPPLRRLPGP